MEPRRAKLETVTAWMLSQQGIGVERMVELFTGTLDYGSQPCSSLIRVTVLLSLPVIITLFLGSSEFMAVLWGRVLEALITYCLKPEAGVTLTLYRCTLPLPHSHAQQDCRVLPTSDFHIGMVST